MSVSRTKRTVTGTRAAKYKMAIPRQVEEELVQLSQLGWNLGESHRKLYRAIRSDPSASIAFEKLTAGLRAIPPVILLLSLEAEGFSRGEPRQDWKDWDRWKDKWEDLGRTARSLKRIASSMEKHIKRNDRGPIPLPTLLPTTEGEAADKEREEYSRSHQANARLTAIVASLLENALEIERFCQMRHNWLQRMPRKHRDTIQSERRVLFLRFVEARTGESHFEDIAALFNVCTRVSQPNAQATEFSADYLRKLSNRFSTPLIKSKFPPR